MEYFQSECGIPGHVVGGGSDRKFRLGTETVDREGGIIEGRQADREAGVSRVADRRAAGQLTRGQSPTAPAVGPNGSPPNF